ncbi:hypothetical protein ACFLUG_01410 [Chloroflexota bacterium]
MPDSTDKKAFIKPLQTGTSIHKQVTAPQIGAFGERDLEGRDFSLGWSLLTEPFLMVEDSHSHDFDQLILFFGGDSNNIGEFDGEVEFGLGEKEELHSITAASLIFIPGGVNHGPLNVKRVGKPFMFIDITFSPGPSIRPVPEGNERE